MASAVSKKIQLSVIIYDFEPRGVQRSQIKLANEFAALGYPVDALVFSNKGPMILSLSEEVRVIDLAAASAKSSLWRLVNYLRSETPDVLFSAEDHVNAIVLSARLLAPARIKYSISCHVSPKLWAARSRFGTKPWLVKKLVSYFYPRADQCVALSVGMVNEYQEFVGLKEGVMKVIYNPVLSGHKIEQSADLHAWLQDPSISVFVGVGNLSRIKGFDDLVRAVAQMEQSNVRLIIVGDGPEKNNLAKLAQGLGLSGCVDLVGYQPNPEVYMEHANGFILSSRSEGLPTVLIEAIGVGCPVVSTKCGGGVLEIMENGRLGPLVDVGDIEGLVAAMRSVLDNPPDKELLRKSAQRFRTDIIARQYVEDLVD